MARTYTHAEHGELIMILYQRQLTRVLPKSSCWHQLTSGNHHLQDEAELHMTLIGESRQVQTIAVLQMMIC